VKKLIKSALSARGDFPTLLELDLFNPAAVRKALLPEEDDLRSEIQTLQAEREQSLPVLDNLLSENTTLRTENETLKERSQSSTKKGHPAIDGETHALAVLAKNPDWTDKQIAKAVGINRTSLYRYEKFKLARKLCKGARQQELRNKRPRGTRTVDPHNKRASAHLEAWQEPDPEDDEE
jgi:hypothetical protein